MQRMPVFIGVLFAASVIILFVVVTEPEVRVSTDGMINLTLWQTEGSKLMDVYDFCSWSPPGRNYSLPYGKRPREVQYRDFIANLNSHDVIYQLNAGTLLGSFRHGGPIPGDRDMDLVLPSCHNTRHLSGSFGNWSCEQLLRQCPPRTDVLWNAQVGETLLRAWWGDGSDFQHAWPAVPDDKNAHLCPVAFRHEVGRQLMPLLTEKLGISRNQIQFTTYGLRVGFADVRIEGRSEDEFGPLCRCRWADTWALCGEQAARFLLTRYGRNVLTPDRKLQYD